MNCWSLRLGAAAIVAVMVAVSASAQDLRAVSTSGAQTQWSRFYIGLNSGYGWDDQSVGISGNSASEALYLASGVAPRSVAITPRGFIGGLHAGYDHQFGRFVVGIETDLAYSDIRNGRSVSTGGIITTVDNSPQPLGYVNNYASYLGSGGQVIEALGTLRVRAGILETDRILFYGTGGLAYGRASLSAAVTNNGTYSEWIASSDGSVVYIEQHPACRDICASGSTSKWLVGGTFGGGFEYALIDRWTARIEYLYYNLGRLSVTAVDPRFPAYAFGASAVFAGHIARFGISYRLN
jgi:outer membrane immunogenic protein